MIHSIVIIISFFIDFWKHIIELGIDDFYKFLTFLNIQVYNKYYSVINTYYTS